jgi:hypothetical protein
MWSDVDRSGIFNLSDNVLEKIKSISVVKRQLPTLILLPLLQIYPYTRNSKGISWAKNDGLLNGK